MNVGVDRPDLSEGDGGTRPPSSASTEWAPVPDQDRRLVVAAQAGDRAAFDQLARRHSVRLRRILVRIAASPEHADDALQDAFLRAWRSLPRFEGRSTFLTWMTRIAINEALRSIERSDGTAAVPLDDRVGERIPNWGAGPDAVFASREFLAALEAALGRLPLPHRQAVVLRDVEGFTTREAAEALGIEPRALKSRLHRGRMALRHELDGYFGDDP